MMTDTNKGAYTSAHGSIPANDPIHSVHSAPIVEDVPILRTPLAFVESSDQGSAADGAYGVWLDELPEHLVLPEWVYNGDLEHAPKPPTTTFAVSDDPETMLADMQALQEEFRYEHLHRVARAIRAKRAFQEQRAGEDEHRSLRGLENLASGFTAYNYSAQYGSAMALEIAERWQRGLTSPDKITLQIPPLRRRGPKRRSRDDLLLLLTEAAMKCGAPQIEPLWTDIYSKAGAYQYDSLYRARTTRLRDRGEAIIKLDEVMDLASKLAQKNVS